MKVFFGILASLILLASVCAVPVFADYTVPPKKEIPKMLKEKIEKDRAEKMPKHAKENMSYKLSMKNKYMKIKATTGIKIDLPDTKKSNEKTKFKTTDGVKVLTKSQGTKNKQVGVKTSQLPKQ